MPHLLTVSRAARLVGLSRGVVQRKIQDGELPTFEGMVNPKDLLRVFPNTQLGSDKEFERVTRIKANAFGKRVVDHVLPDADVLATRLKEVGKELASAKIALKQYRSVFQQLYKKLEDDTEPGARNQLAKDLHKWLGAALEREQTAAKQVEPLLLQDSMLSVMSAHVHVQPSGHEFFVQGQDTVLEAALRAGINLDYRCSNGNCGACKARIVSGDVKKTKNFDYVIGEADKGRGYTLLCCHTAVTDLVIEAPEASSADDIPVQKIRTRAKSIERLTDDIILLGLQTPRTQRLRFLAGQSAQLSAGDIKAEYPVASCPCDDRNIQFYIKNQPDRPFSQYIFNQLHRDDSVNIEGPFGSYVLKENSHRSLIFIAWDGGFAPINSLIEHAMALEMAEHMHLYWVVSENNTHYRDNLCRAWADALDNFTYEAIIAGKHPRDRLNYIFNRYKYLNDYDVFVAGPENVVSGTRMLLENRAFPEKQLATQVVN